MSLTETIINMAQNFVGSNNINLLMPNGQFGSRHQGGKDHASARYVFTCMSRLTRKIFPESDDHSLTYVEDDGQMVEPTYYVPILPMVLVNGNKGIGTGWSTHIPNYDPRELCRIMMDMINDKPAPENLLPWYKGYLGDIVMKPNGKSVETRGVIEATDDPTMIHVTDLPVGRWTKDYKEQLDKFIDEDRTVVTIKEHHTDNKIHFEIQLDEDFQRNNENNLHSALKLSNSIHLGNLVAFNRNNIIRRYENVR
jgi:DNA topoisomerase-2